MSELPNYNPPLVTPPLALPSRWKLDTRNVGDGLKLLKTIPDNSVALVIFDPEYRELLDRQGYGNEGKNRQKERAQLPQMSAELIARFNKEIARALMESCYLARWTDKFCLAEGKVGDIPGLKLVDWITWDSQSFGMGYRSRHRGEQLTFYQKYPLVTWKKKGVVRAWRSSPSIANVWAEKVDPKLRKLHPHCKPFGLTKTIIEAMTLPGDIVVDPTAGSFTTMDAALAVGRRFLGTDLVDFSQEGAAPHLRAPTPSAQPLWKVQIKCGEPRTLQLDHLDELSEWLDESGLQPEEIGDIVITLNRGENA
jgi:site-specific DNA-methyltransferase (adenine-specific)